MPSKVAPGDVSAEDGPFKTSDDILDHYLQLPWYTQTWYSLTTAVASVWRKQVVANGPQATKEKLKSFWTTIGVVSALLLSITYSLSVTPPKLPESTDETEDISDKETALSVATIFSGVSLMFSLTVIVITVIYMVEIDNCTTDRDLTDFIINNSHIFDILIGIFSGSVVLLVGSALAMMYVNYKRYEFLVVACTTGVIILLGAIFASVVAGRNRFILWARFDSPLAKDGSIHPRAAQHNHGE
mmetsp:Transcript_21398/g.46858  ORF Transcript_21398/g.46858 Transcript_21398/m.46858 type:complete len:243 (-) Transcript_21398:1333-2061(-)|eukprot:CAMPEP_0202892738 /NCGR_PEP_ID=MMETSP1392-20130828/2435_1 /ASSEMBLY_ACC=CAM_ASM_000868 /TAXON_ID=225041 /ORGANISM="Chlamydomonas chlamydogama, Strain SAG 11-48b" /LENGTH=242 /DNA_ID=CAMNT_0049576801 /DNA_START=235 /DNA_END=963 /DNA_ORIENTATION=-